MLDCARPTAFQFLIFIGYPSLERFKVADITAKCLEHQAPKFTDEGKSSTDKIMQDRLSIRGKCQLMVPKRR